MKITLLTIALFLAVCASGEEIATKHYDITLEDKEWNASEVSELADAAYDYCKTFFGVEIKEQMRVKISSDGEQFRRWLAAAARTQVEDDRLLTNKWARGWYHSASRTVFLHSPPTHGGRVHGLVHELVHQFHDISKPYQARGVDFYIEGVAEHISHCVYEDGKWKFATLATALGTDTPALALEAAKARGAETKLQTLFSANRVESYQLAWACFTYMIENHNTDFRKWMDLVDNGSRAREIWNHIFGNDLSLADVIKWLETKQLPK